MHISASNLSPASAARVSRSVPVRIDTRHLCGEFDLICSEYYDQSSPSLRLFRDGRFVAMVTINIGSFELEPGTFHVRDWGQSVGIVESLIDQGIVESLGFNHEIAYVNARVCRLTDKALQLFNGSTPTPHGA